MVEGIEEVVLAEDLGVAALVASAAAVEDSAAAELQGVGRCAASFQPNNKNKNRPRIFTN